MCELPQDMEGCCGDEQSPAKEGVKGETAKRRKGRTCGASVVRSSFFPFPHFAFSPILSSALKGYFLAGDESFDMHSHGRLGPFFSDTDDQLRYLTMAIKKSDPRLRNKIK